MNLGDEIDRNGFAILPGVLTAEQVRSVLRDATGALDRQSQAAGSIRGPDEIYAARNLLEAWPAVIAVREPTEA